MGQSALLHICFSWGASSGSHLFMYCKLEILYSIAFHVSLFIGLAGLWRTAVQRQQQVHNPGSACMVRLGGLPCIQLFHGSQVVLVGALPPERGFDSASSRGKHQLANLLMPFSS